jgi:adenine phosphoribosyltransferase
MIDLKNHIMMVQDYPKPGIRYRDITPLLAHPPAFRQACEKMSELVRQSGAEAVFGVESRGFIFAAPVAIQLGLPLVLVRKHGKLPRTTHKASYELEYGVDHLEVHRDDVQAGQRCIVIDDVLATGGTAGAVVKLLELAGAHVAGAVFLIELLGLGGAASLAPHPVHSLLHYELSES